MTKNEQKVLNFIIQNPRLDYLAVEIQKGSKISKAGAHIALKSLVKQKWADCQKRGKTFFYSVNFEDPAIREFKQLNNVLKLRPLVKTLSTHALKIILFGSAARGEDMPDSDLDLFILTSLPNKVRALIKKISLPYKPQPFIKTPVDFVKFEKQNPVLAQEINQGITLWPQH